MATKSNQPASEHEWSYADNDRCGDYTREVAYWRIGEHQVHPCGHCGTPVLSGLVCRQEACVEVRMSGRPVGASWTVAA